MNKDVTRILIVDNHQMFTEGLKALLIQNPNYKVVGILDDGAKLIAQLKHLECDVILLDINMPKVDGIKALKELRKVHLHMPVIMLSTYANAEFLGNVMALGISGYLSKNTSREDLYTAIDLAIAGEQFFDESIKPFIDKVVKELTSDTRSFSLTDRELDVLKLLAKGKTSSEIADKLSISNFTVETHKKNMLLKLNMRNLMELVKYATARGIG